MIRHANFRDRIRYGSLCDGIGAAHAAWQPLGCECAWTSELLGSFPAAVVEHRWGFRNFGDMTEYLTWPETVLSDINVLVGGTPCQPFSVAGERRSLDDKRSNLTLTYVSIFHHINEVRKRDGRPPAIALWENVPGVLSTKDNAFGHLLGGLLGCNEALETESGRWPRAGFFSTDAVRVGYRVLDAQYFAVAQRRRRVFLVAVPSELIDRFGARACPSEILSLRESLLGNPPSRGAMPQEAARSAGNRLAGRSAGPEPERQDCEPCNCVAFHHNAQGCQLPSCSRDTSIADSLTTSQGAAVAFTKPKRDQSSTDDETWGPGDVSPTMRCCDHGDARATNVVALQDCEFPDKTQNGKGWRADGTSYTLTSMTTQGIAGALRIDSDVPQCESAPLAVDGRKRAAKKDVHRAQHVERDSSDAVAVGSSEVAGTLTASRGTGFRSNGTPIEGVAVLPMDVRRMTPREYEWLQGFPDGYTRVPYRGKLASDSPRYRALGNSMAVPVMHWLGRRIAAVFTPDNSRAHAADGECPPTTP